MFVHRNAYHPRKVGPMHPSCTACGEDFQKEPGFYFGAAYVSYAMTVALWIALLAALMTFDRWGLIEFSMFTHPKTFLGWGIALLVSLMPLIYRMSRSIWLAMFSSNEKRDPHV